MGNTETCRLTDCPSSNTQPQHSRGSRVEWINKQYNSSCRWICFCSCLCFSFLPRVHAIFSPSIIHHVHNVYYWLLSFHMNLLSAAFKIKPAVNRIRCWKCFRSSVVITAPHTPLTYDILNEQFLFLQTGSALATNPVGSYYILVFKNKNCLIMGWILLSETEFRWC